jgi:hypothetical protein
MESLNAILKLDTLRMIQPVEIGPPISDSLFSKSLQRMAKTQ